MFEQQAADILGIPFDEWTQGRPRDRGLHAGHRLQAGEAGAARDGRVVERLELPGLSPDAKRPPTRGPAVSSTYGCPTYRARTLWASSPLRPGRSDEHTSELQSLMRNSYAVICLK